MKIDKFGYFRPHESYNGWIESTILEWIPISNPRDYILSDHKGEIVYGRYWMLGNMVNTTRWRNTNNKDQHKYKPMIVDISHNLNIGGYGDYGNGQWPGIHHSYYDHEYFTKPYYKSTKTNKQYWLFEDDIWLLNKIQRIPGSVSISKRIAKLKTDRDKLNRLIAEVNTTK